MPSETIPYGCQSIDASDVDAVVAALRSPFLTTGPAVDRFEHALSAVVGGVPTVAVSSGTAALHAAYAAAGLGPGTTLVTTPLTFAATATAALHLGAEVVFADVCDDTLTLAPDAAAAVIDARTAAVCAVDYAGHPADLDTLGKLARNAGAVLVEDAAHSLGSRLDGRAVGTLADLTTFSFHPVKTITTGEGGAVAVRDERLLDPVRRFRSHGLVREHRGLVRGDEGGWHQEVQELGLNYRLPDLLAALGTSQLARLDRFVARRAELVARYRTHLADVGGLRLPTSRPGAEPAWHLFPVRVQGGRRRELYERLRERGILTQVHYLPVHLQPLFAGLGHRPGSCPVAETAYTELLSLPLYPDLTDAQQDRVVTEIRDILGN